MTELGSKTMSDAAIPDRVTSHGTGRLRLIRRLSLGAVASLAIGWFAWFCFGSRSDDVPEVIQRATAYGYYSTGYRPTPLSMWLGWVPQSRQSAPLGSQPVYGIGLPANFVSNALLDDLCGASELGSITVYPVTDTPGLLEGGQRQKLASLRDLDLPLSEESIARLEGAFPALQVYAVVEPVQGTAIADEQPSTDEGSRSPLEGVE